MLKNSILTSLIFLAATASGLTRGAPLPAQYFRLLEAGAERVDSRLGSESAVTLEQLESSRGWRHFPYAILAPAVLYAKPHPENPRYQDPRMLDLAVRIGDLLAREDEAGTFEPRLDSDWDTYIWLEAWHLLEPQLGEERRLRWKRAIERNVALVLRDAEERLHFPWYNSPYIGTSPNHYAQYASNLLLAGEYFGNQSWKELGARILHRFATVEQTSDGFWGEHSRRGPTTGYNLLTLTSVALYWEHSKDPSALDALRRSTDFHKYFTYPDGTPVEVINDRNRHWGVSAWGQFAFSNFPDGRGYAEFLVDFFEPDNLTMDALGRLAQDALYYHEGPVEPPPQRLPGYSHQMEVPAGIRKTGSWVVCLSGIVDTQAINSRYYLDRQAHLSIFHETLGQIVSGGNSKRQPELATFSERMLGQVRHLPLSSRLQMGELKDRLSLAYNTFWADLEVPQPSEERISFSVILNGKGRPAEETTLALQLVLESGETLKTSSGFNTTLSEEPLLLSPDQIGGEIHHRGWRLTVPPGSRLRWPVYPHNPYADAPETSLEYAVGLLTVPVELQSQERRYVRPRERVFVFGLRVE